MKLSCSIIFILLSYPPYGYADFKEGGYAYIDGDYETAANEFIPLAERGDHRAMYALGSMYAAGHGVEKDLKKSFELFSEAAKYGRADAMYKLGLMYEQGQGVKENQKKAIRYYQKSAKKGYPLAQYRFGLMYEKGLGAQQNLINAYAWLVIAGHYFIYVPINLESENNDSLEGKKQQILFFQQQEMDRVFGDITEHLQKIKQNMNAEDIEKVKMKVIALSKYRKRYHAKKIRSLKIESSIESLFLPETLY
ncbi:MAG TPA: sel1 repeat family protein [Thiotrichaceae bacterium]|jgi:TPR repeat protein|nr:sel1 repeat family protein [Thiotrichaceae bacterium]HIM08169.1 sel1 repeat family protein [Gammaproteobacteria bacterium]